MQQFILNSTSNSSNLNMEILEQTLRYLGNNCTNRKFRSHFGISIHTAILLWEFLKNVELPFEIQPVHLLWTFYFLKLYNPVDVASQFWNCDCKTYRLYVWRVICALFVYLNSVIVFVMLLNLNFIVDFIRKQVERAHWFS